MNILIPHHWLLEHLDTKASPQQIQKYLSLCGPSVERVEMVKQEPVYDIEVTTNRADAMSVYGIAREAAAILPEFGIKAKLKPLNLNKINSTKKLAIKIKNDPQLCRRVITVKLANIKLGPSPQWLQKRLIQVGQRPLNNAIDITNYIMWEIGHPIHIFDYDRLTNKTIIIRQAKKGEQVITLDNKKHTLVGGEVVFDNGQGQIIDVPGIMGTKNTVVTNKTKNGLLLVESILPEKIRFASMTHAIRSQAAVLNEKHVDPELAKTAVLKSTLLYQKLCQAKPDSQLFDTYPQKSKPQPCLLTQKKLDTYLGVKVEPKRVSRILTALGCQVKIKESKNKAKEPSASYKVTPPTFRSNDLKIPADYIEEIARIYGYHNLPSVIMDTPLPPHPPQENFNLEYQIKQWLTGWGLTEIYTYSMVSQKLAQKSGFKLKNHLKLKNPLNDDWVYMRRSLIPSLHQALKDNKNLKKLSLFEMAHVYLPSLSHKPKAPIKTELPLEQLHLTLATTRNLSFLKGILDALLKKLFIKDALIKPIASKTGFLDNQIGEIYSGSTKLGHLGQTSQDPPILSLDLNLKNLISVSSDHPHYIPQISHPPIIEDLTFTLPQQTFIGPVITSIKNCSSLIETVILKDIYKQNYTFTITYRHPKKSLKDKDIAPIRQTIDKVLSQKHSASLIGKL